MPTPGWPPCVRSNMHPTPEPSPASRQQGEMSTMAMHLLDAATPTPMPPPTPAGPVLQTRELSKRFGPVLALDRATLDVPSGCTGLLGPNGAGKSTLIKLALGLLAPDDGETLVAGADPARDPM